MPSTPMTVSPLPILPWAMWTTGMPRRNRHSWICRSTSCPTRCKTRSSAQAAAPATGVSAENADVFRADWGIQPDRVLSPIRMPSTDVLMEGLNLYQTEFRKPSLTVYCLDYSGSMEGTGREQMVEAMSQILIQENAEKNLLQASAHEVNILIPFEGYPRDVYAAVGNGSELEALYTQVEAETATGGTDIYSAAMEGLRQLKNYDLSQYTPAIILLTECPMAASTLSKPPMRHSEQTYRCSPSCSAPSTPPSWRSWRN